jgi:DNA-binding PadR family transcriptional regulator
VSKLFGHGDLRLWLLKLLDERPRHGYDIIAGLEEQFLGLYSPSPGTVYPRLSALEQEGLIEVDREDEGRKVFRLTDLGRKELDERREELSDLAERLTRSARDIARVIKDDVKSSVRDLKNEVRRAAQELRRDERRASRTAKDAAREAREVARVGRDAARAARDAARDAGDELRSAWRSLQADLDGFVSDVVSAARRHDLDRDRLERLRSALREARASIVEALDGSGRRNRDDRDDTTDAAP